MPFKFNPITGKLDLVDGLPSANSTRDGYLTSTDWNIFNAKLDADQSNYFPNPGFETDLTGVAMYNDQGRTDPAFVVEADLTFTSTSPGDAGNGVNVNYIFHVSQSYLTPLVTVVSPTEVTVAWYNGPTLANNPTATQLKAAWDAVPGAVAIATCAITGTAGNRQYITGSHLLAGGGDVSPVDLDGGTPTGIGIARSTVAPLQGVASLIFSKDAANRQGQGVAFDFQISPLDRGQTLQISMGYLGSADFAVGTNSDVTAWVFDVTNAVFLPVSTRKTLIGPALTAVTFVCSLDADPVSVNYRFGLHIATQNALAWDLQIDAMIANNQISDSAATQVPKVVAEAQPITALVTDRMAVMWQDGNLSWRPATMASGADSSTLYGFATNIVGLTADITLYGYLDGFSFGPFAGYNQYVDSAAAGSISPSPAVFTDAYVVMGKGVSADTIFVRPHVYNRLVTSKGGILTNRGTNDGTGDVVQAAGTTGQFLRYNTALVNGFGPFTPVCTAPLVYTAATSTWSMAAATAAVNGYLTAANFVIFNAKAPTASPTFTGDVNSSTGSVLISTTGQGIRIKTGTNAKIGTAVLVGGTVTVANTSVTANSRIFLTSNTDGGTPGWLRVSAKVNGTSFTITSSNVLDTSTVAWMIVESIP